MYSTVYAVLACVNVGQKQRVIKFWLFSILSPTIHTAIKLSHLNNMCERHVARIKLLNVHRTHARTLREKKKKNSRNANGGIKQYSVHGVHMIFVGVSPCEYNFQIQSALHTCIQMAFVCMIRSFPLSWLGVPVHIWSRQISRLFGGCYCIEYKINKLFE